MPLCSPTFAAAAQKNEHKRADYEKIWTGHEFTTLLCWLSDAPSVGVDFSVIEEVMEDRWRWGGDLRSNGSMLQVSPPPGRVPIRAISHPPSQPPGLDKMVIIVIADRIYVYFLRER